MSNKNLQLFQAALDKILREQKVKKKKNNKKKVNISVLIPLATAPTEY